VDIRNLLKNLSNRERILLYGAFVFILLFLIYQILFVPLLNSRRELVVENSVLETRFNELKSIAERYEAEKLTYTQFKEMLGRKKSLSVLTFLENISEMVGIRDNIEYIKPKGNERKEGIVKSGVEIKIDAVSVQKLIEFLYEIEENRNGLIVSYLRLKPFFKEKGKVDVIVGITDVTVE
jgi:general secretion pathway protein M